MKLIKIIPSLVLGFTLSGCSSVYYDAMEKVGVHKRDILVDRVEEARDSQEEAQETFQSALEKFGSVVEIKDSNLKRAYENLNSEYEDSVAAAEEVSGNIESIENVATALFKEWEAEIKEISNANLRRSSAGQLRQTRANYGQMLSTMHKAESSMQPVLTTFKDNVLFLKHNLNAQAIGALHSEFTTLKSEIAGLIKKMNQSIASSNKFIAGMKGS